MKRECILIHPPNACDSQGWTRLNPGAKNSVQMFQVGGRDRNIWAITCYLPRACILRKLESWEQNEDWILDTPRGIVDVPRSQLIASPNAFSK